MNFKVHVVPNNDTISHRTEMDDDCICGPTPEPVEREDGSIGWLVVHHSLDGREQKDYWQGIAMDAAREWLKDEE